MAAISITLEQIAKLSPCERAFSRAQIALPKRRKITAAMAKTAGVSFDDIIWTASAVARWNTDVERRVRLWLADCAAHVLHIYQKTGSSAAPRNATIAARQFARGEIDAAARDAAWAAAWAAAWDAERGWQFDRFVLWFSDAEPEDIAI